MYKFFVLAFSLFLAGCTNLQVVEKNAETGYFPGNKRATVTTSIKTDLDKSKDLILVPNDDFTSNMVKNIGYFTEVITFEDLEKRIIENNLTDQVPSINNRIGINKAAKAYKKFLWIRWDSRRDGSKRYKQLILADPITLEDLFVCETLLDYVWTGVNDTENWYPMMNSLIDYIKENSSSFK